MPKPIVSVDLRFKEPTGDALLFMPAGVPTWIAGLESVPTDMSLVDSVYRDAPLGYAYIDARLIANSKHRQVHLAMWLAIKSAWVRYIEGSPGVVEKALSVKQWRGFVQYAVEDRVSQTLSARQHVLGYDAVQAKLSSTSVLTSRPRTFFWRCLRQVDSPGFTNSEMREALWELTESNFRFDLIALDRCLHAGSDWTQPESSASRIEALAQLFHDGKPFPETMPASNLGLVAENWQDRLVFVAKLRQVMCSWVKVRELWMTQLDGQTSRDDFEAVEIELVRDLCQLFFSKFGRPLTTPRYVSM